MGSYALPKVFIITSSTLDLPIPGSPFSTSAYSPAAASKSPFFFSKCARTSVTDGCGRAAACAAIGLTHSYQLHGNDIDYAFTFITTSAAANSAATTALNTSPASTPPALLYHAYPQAIGYLALAAVFALFSLLQSRVGLQDASHD